MKKILSAVLVSLALTVSSAFAQENAVRTGAFINYEPTVGSLSEYINCNLGGGISAEYGIALPWLNLEAGPAVHAIFNGNILNSENSDLFSIVWNMRFSVGGFIRIPFGESGFSIQPEIDYGMAVYLPKANPEYENELKKTYIDQTLQFALGLRYAIQSVLDGNLEIILTPTYTYSPEQQASFHFIGARLGAMYRVM